MADRKPPRPIADERTTMLALLSFQRESLIAKVDGLDDQSATSVSMPSGTTLLWLVQHMAVAETLWIAHRYLGESPRADDPGAAPTGTVDHAVAEYRRAAERTDATLSAAADLDELCATTGSEPPVSLRWVLAHLLEETARHAGHADILRELTDGATGR
ncbi:MAG: DinB family protein [Acidimicrobiales bacterium]